MIPVNQSMQTDNQLIMFLNFVGVVLAFGLLGLSLYLSVDVPLATKGYWGMAVLLLSSCLINLVKYRFDNQAKADRINQIETAKNSEILEKYVGDDVK